MVYELPRALSARESYQCDVSATCVTSERVTALRGLTLGHRSGNLKKKVKVNDVSLLSPVEIMTMPAAVKL